MKPSPKSNGDDAAFPVAGTIATGLSKRELLAGLALQGLITHCGAWLPHLTGCEKGLAEQTTTAVRYADALLAALAE